MTAKIYYLAKERAKRNKVKTDNLQQIAIDCLMRLNKFPPSPMDYYFFDAEAKAKKDTE